MARVVIVAVIVVQFAFAFPNGIRGSRSNYTYQARGAVVLRTIDKQSNSFVVYYLYIFSNASVHPPAGEDAPAAPPQRVRACGVGLVTGPSQYSRVVVTR